jgi:hypothetical protein
MSWNAAVTLLSGPCLLSGNSICLGRLMGDLNWEPPEYEADMPPTKPDFWQNISSGNNM